MNQGNKYLSKSQILMHINEKKKKRYTNKKFNVFFDGKVLQLCFYSKGCKFSNCGSCIMCDYGEVRKENLSPDDIKEIFHSVLKNLKKTPKVLLLNSLGSILDPAEIPLENLITLLDELANIDIDVIIFETHYLTINNDILSLIKKKLPHKEIVIELGLESSNAKIRERCLNKHINNKDFIRRINLIKAYGFIVEANVIYGSPFLTEEEQELDTINTIKWCFNNNVDNVNLFPINIKPYTLLYKLYQQGKYTPVLHTNFIKVLNKIPKEYINKIYLCWYGNRELAYGEGKTICPQCGENEYPTIMSFYRAFNLNRDKEHRKELLRSIIQWLDSMKKNNFIASYSLHRLDGTTKEEAKLPSVETARKDYVLEV